MFVPLAKGKHVASRYPVICICILNLDWAGLYPEVGGATLLTLLTFRSMLLVKRIIKLFTDQSCFFCYNLFYKL